MNEHRPSAAERLPGETEITRLYRALPQTEPAPELDAAVRAAARSDRRARRPRWLPGLGAAAAVLLAAGLAWRIGEVRPPVPEVAPPGPAVSAERREAPPAPAPTPPGTLADRAQEEVTMSVAVPATPPARSRHAADARLQAPAAAARGITARPPPAAPAGTATAGLDDIRTLLAAGQREAARRALTAFRDRNPDAPIPEDLLPLLEPR